MEQRRESGRGGRLREDLCALDQEPHGLDDLGVEQDVDLHPEVTDDLVVERPGERRAERVDENIAAAGLALSANEIAALSAALVARPLFEQLGRIPKEEKA